MKFPKTVTEINLDSFLDIITNVIGVLVLIACAIALQIQNYEPPKTTPTMEKPPGHLRFTFFVCGKQRCRIVRNVNSGIYKNVIRKTGANKQTRKTTAFINRVNERDDWDPDFSIKLKQEKFQIVMAQIRLKEKAEELLANVRDELSKLDPAKDGVFFHVHSDSFEAFRQARAYAKELGFRVGWIPIANDHLKYVVENPWNIPIEGSGFSVESE